MNHEHSPRHILVASCLVRNEANEILLVKHYQRDWELPQGRVENGEALLEGLHREVYEETGIRISAPRLATVWSKLSEPTAAIFCFCADYLSGELTPSEETPELNWFPEQQALAMITHPVNHDRVRALLSNPGVTEFMSYRTGPYLRVG
ncbi:MAG TPA: NUDIX hydrolase [Geothermobacteraceae bacterium]|nr:NUDIX hydrolase [Geothermobacteraceae bacterium]